MAALASSDQTKHNMGRRNDLHASEPPAPEPSFGSQMSTLSQPRNTLFCTLAPRPFGVGKNYYRQILERDGDNLSWAAVQAPVGDIPSARHGHSACEVPVTAGYAARVSQGGVLVFGGEGRTKEGQEVRSTDSHEILLYDLEVTMRLVVDHLCSFAAFRTSAETLHAVSRFIWCLSASSNETSSVWARSLETEISAEARFLRLGQRLSPSSA